MWTARKGYERKKEFIETAIEMFIEKDYEKTSINDILKVINVTKGSFYYYFDSKEELIDAIVVYLTQEIQESIEVIYKKNDLCAIQKLEHIFHVVNQIRQDNSLVYRQIYDLQKKDKNAYISKKIMERVSYVNIKYIKLIIEQGIKEGVFSTTNSEEMAELYVYLVSRCKEKIASIITDPSFEDNSYENYKKINDLILFYQNVLERVLCVPSGTLHFIVNE